MSSTFDQVIISEEWESTDLSLLETLDHVLNRVRKTPLQFPSVSAGVRRALLPTFPYAVYFRDTEQAVVILAVLHLRRDPRIWRGRS